MTTTRTTRERSEKGKRIQEYNGWVGGGDWWRLCIRSCVLSVGGQVLGSSEGGLVWRIGKRNVSLVNAMRKILEITGEAGAGVTSSWVETEPIILSLGSPVASNGAKWDRKEEGKQGAPLACDGEGSRQQQREGGKRLGHVPVIRVWVRLESTPIPDTTRPVTEEQVKMESANARVQARIQIKGEQTKERLYE
ncbi:hypothetical protein EDB83DRAFT_2321106 [Lactarius deliciosus]|nr:hypothetical protein EDB83DRAFT_2321106 [Lactarius deliciosus]